MKTALSLFALLLMACAEPMPEPCVPDCHPWNCVPASQKAEACTMIYKVGGNCYAKYATCERQASGQCGWTADDSLQACIDAERGGMPSGEVR